MSSPREYFIHLPTYCLELKTKQILHNFETKIDWKQVLQHYDSVSSITVVLHYFPWRPLTQKMERKRKHYKWTLNEHRKCFPIGTVRPE